MDFFLPCCAASRLKCTLVQQCISWQNTPKKKTEQFLIILMYFELNLNMASWPWMHQESWVEHHHAALLPISQYCNKKLLLFVILNDFYFHDTVQKESQYGSKRDAAVGCTTQKQTWTLENFFTFMSLASSFHSSEHAPPFNQVFISYVIHFSYILACEHCKFKLKNKSFLLKLIAVFCLVTWPYSYSIDQRTPFFSQC